MAYRIEKRVQNQWVPLGPKGKEGTYATAGAAEWTIGKFKEMDDVATDYRVVPDVEETVAPAGN